MAGALTENFAGPGTFTCKLARERAVELAVRLRMQRTAHGRVPTIGRVLNGREN
jgi:hypothetical protein